MGLLITLKESFCKFYSSLYLWINKNIILSIEEYPLIFKINFLHRKTLKRLERKNIINCVFFVSDIADWKCDNVYKLMSVNKRFNTHVLITPACNYENELVILKQHQCIEFFRSHQYNFIVAFDEDSKTYLDVKKDLSPDIIIYTSPYKSTADKRYYISAFSDALGIYIPYGFTNNKNLDYQYNLLLHNMVWRYYVESENHLYYFKHASRCKGRSGVVTGYPAIENLISPHKKISLKSWKCDNNAKKRIIWAPHHTIETKGIVVYSCFLVYAEFMVQMAQKYKDVVQIAFKPHPLLKTKLYNVWGKDRTDNYYQMWEEMPNTFLCEGDYVDLFLSSDAMIHDSGSFITEYLYVNKPVMRTINDIPLDSMYNSFTLKCLDQYYLARNEQEIEHFIQNVINDEDPLKEKRSNFVNEVLMPKKSPSQSIIDDILDSIDNQILYRN